MSQLKTKSLEDSSVEAAKIATDAVTTAKIAANAVDDTKLRLTSTGWLKSRNAANSADLNLVRYNGIDKIEFADGFVFQNGGNVVIENEGPSGSLTVRSDNQTGVSTNSGAIVIESGNAAGATSNSGDVTIQSGTATQTRGDVDINGREITLNSNAGADVIVNSNNDFVVSAVLADLGACERLLLPFASSDPTGVTEGEMYYNTTSNVVKYYDGASWITIGTGTGLTEEKETFVLVSGDITNGYIDLANVARTDSITFIVKGLGPLLEGASYDYSVNYTGGAGGNTRITFLNDIATGGGSALVAGDVIQVKYSF